MHAHFGHNFSQIYSHSQLPFPGCGFPGGLKPWHSQFPVSITPRRGTALYMLSENPSQLLNDGTWTLELMVVKSQWIHPFSIPSPGFFPSVLLRRISGRYFTKIKMLLSHGSTQVYRNQSVFLVFHPWGYPSSCDPSIHPSFTLTPPSPPSAPHPHSPAESLDPRSLESIHAHEGIKESDCMPTVPQGQTGVRLHVVKGQGHLETPGSTSYPVSKDLNCVIYCSWLLFPW